MVGEACVFFPLHESRGRAGGCGPARFERYSFCAGGDGAMHCTSCNSENREQARFCATCGQPFPVRCAGCGQPRLAKQRFCDACGHPAEAPVDSAPAASAGTGPEPLHAERKIVTALFADIKGFTALLEDMDPEEARNVIDPALEIMMQAVHRYDGFVAQSLGDGIFALFGAPIAHEDHALRALHAALAMQEGILGLEQGRAPLELRVGVNTGEVVVRSMRKDEQHSDYIPIGHSINLASRMESLATPGTIRVTEETHRLAEGYFSFRDLGTVTVKGVRDPVRTYEVLGLGSTRTRLERSERLGFIGLVGRSGELERMAEVLRGVRDGRGGILAIRGEPGMGKSRLCYEFSRCHLADCRVLKTFSVSHGKANAYQSLIGLLQEYFGWRPEDDSAARRRRATDVVRALGPELADTLPYLFHLLGIAEPGQSLAQMDAEIRRERCFQAIERILHQESLRQVVVLLFEDLQWADLETLAFLTSLSESIATQRILVLVNYRPEYTEAFWSARVACTELRLLPLGQAGSEELLEALLGADPALDPLKRRIFEGSGGNPFFMEEIARGLIEQGIVRREPGGSVLAQPLLQISIPSTVQDVIAARIDRLGADAKALLQTLAVVGMQFSLALVQEVSARPLELVQKLLQHLIDAGFVLETSSAERYEIKHGLIQEVAYRSLVKERRRALHEQAARALESLYGALLAEHYADLAHHYYNSGNVPKAIDCLELAAQQAAQRSANADAVMQLRRALELLQTLPASPQRDARELGLQLTIGTPLMRSKGWADPEVGRARARALDLAEPLKEAPQMFPALFGLWGYSLVRAEVRTAHKLALQVRSLAEKSGDSGLRVEAYRALSPILYFLGQLGEARELLARGTALYDREAHRGHATVFGQDPGVTILSYASVVSWLLGYPDESRRCSAEALELARELGHPYTLGFALFFASTQHHQRRDVDATLATAEAAIALCTEHGFPLWRAGAMSLHGWARAQRGEIGEGIEEMQSGIDLWRSTGAEITRSYFLAMLAEGHLWGKDCDQALAVIDEALRQAQGTGDLWWQADLYRLQGEAHTDRSLAQASFERGIAVARQQGSLMLELRNAMRLARIAHGKQEKTAALERLRETYGRFREGFDSRELREAATLIAEQSAA
jgi:class 3 adenylate cyclase/predicted ATPase